MALDIAYRAVLADLLVGLDVESSPVEVTGLALDSRQVNAGDLFVALDGGRYDGRDFVVEAFARGAVAVLVHADLHGDDDVAGPVITVPNLNAELGFIAARFYRHPSQDIKIFGVTGTNGKTTTVHCLSQLLQAQGERCGVIGTLGMSLEQSHCGTANTTPDAVMLQRQLAQWRDQGVSNVAMEVSSHALDQGRVNGIMFYAAIFTNLSHDHLDYHGSMDDYRQAKQRLFQFAGLTRAVINADDSAANAMRDVVADAVDVIEYSAQGRQVAVSAQNTHYELGGCTAAVSTPWGKGRLSCPLPGEFNMANVLACLAALGQRQSLASLLQQVTALRGVAGRMEPFGGDGQPRVIVDYAHTPDALARVLAVLRPHVSGQLICVFGCGGDRDRNKRPLMGAAASACADRLVITSDNPRSEDPQAIIDDVIVGCSGPWQREPDRARAIAGAIAQAAPSDCVVVAGKGHEDYQIIGSQRTDFSDAEQVVKALSERVSA